MSWVFEIASFLVRGFLYRQAVRQAEKKAILFLLKALQAARMSLAAALAVFFIIQLMIFGLVGAAIAGLWLTSWELETKLWVLFGVSITLFAVPLIGFFVFFSERVWYRLSGAQSLVDSLDKKTSVLDKVA